MRWPFFAKIGHACEALKRGDAVTISSKRGLHMAVLAEVATRESLALLESKAEGILCVATPAATPIPQLSAAVTERFQVGRIVMGLHPSADVRRLRDYRVLVPISDTRNGVLSRAGPVECVMDLARLACMSPCVITGSIKEMQGNKSSKALIVDTAEVVSVSEMIECRLALQQDWWTTPCHRLAPAKSCAFLRLQQSPDV